MVMKHRVGLLILAQLQILQILLGDVEEQKLLDGTNGNGIVVQVIG